MRKKIFNSYFKHSLTSNLVNATKKSLDFATATSFFCSHFRKKTPENIAIREDSFLLNSSFLIIKGSISKLADILKTSRVHQFISKLRDDFSTNASYSLGLVIICCIIANSIFNLILTKSITLFGWIIRATFLCIGLLGMRASVSWKELKKTCSFLF